MSQYAREIKHILATLNEQGDEDGTSLPDEEELETIHVYPVEGGGLLFTKTPLEDDEAAPPVIESQDDDTRTAPATKTPSSFVLFLLLLCVFVLFDMADTQLLAMLTPTVTVTIVPQAQSVTATADLPAAAIHAHVFAPLTLSLSQTVSATGVGHQDARQATGTLTFYNGLFTPQFVAQGTVFTGSDGVPVANNQSVTIPANTPPVDGQATVAAYALHTGHSGNIAAGDITVTIGNGLLVRNSPFTNGQDARTFAMVTKADIQQVIARLAPRVFHSEQAALSAQLQTGEQLFQPICPSTTTTDHQPGDEAAHVTVTMAETCAATAYSQQALQTQGEQLLNEEARTLDKGYGLVGDRHPIILATKAAGSIRVQFSGTYVYQINLQALTMLISGRPKQHALLLLTSIPGIRHVTIAGITDNTPLPLDTAHIHVQVFVGL